MAIKHIDRVFEVREDALRIVRELRFLRLLKHANVRFIQITVTLRLLRNSLREPDARG